MTVTAVIYAIKSGSSNQTVERSRHPRVLDSYLSLLIFPEINSLKWRWWCRLTCSESTVAIYYLILLSWVNELKRNCSEQTLLSCLTINSSMLPCCSGMLNVLFGQDLISDSFTRVLCIPRVPENVNESKRTLQHASLHSFCHSTLSFIIHISALLIFVYIVFAILTLTASFWFPWHAFLIAHLHLTHSRNHLHLTITDSNRRY